MPLPRVAATIIFAACVLLPACNRHSARHPGITEPDKNQRALALDAVEFLRQQFNSNACQPIYNASSEHFRAQDSEAWTQECELLKKEFGPWRNFQANVAERWVEGDTVVCVMGVAEFENKSQQVGVAWTMKDQGAQLHWLAFRLRDDAIWRQIPAQPWSGGPLIDPPPAKSPKDSLAL